MPTKAELVAQNNELRTSLVATKNRYDQLKQDVVAKARELAVEHDWCSVVEEALEELELVTFKDYDVKLVVKLSHVPEIGENRDEWLRRLVGTTVSLSRYTESWESESEEGSRFQWQLEVVEQ